MSNKDAAIFYLEALREDFKRGANRHYFRAEYVSYRDLSIREAQINTAIGLVENLFARVPVDEPSDQQLRDIGSSVA